MQRFKAIIDISVITLTFIILTGDKNISILHSSCKDNVMHLSFKSVCNKEHKGVICNMTSLSYSYQRTHNTG